ncbi:aspartate/glutamate racemase family protein [Ramlibacter sp. H39-3-26]|uniref:aspartate/glutamate racemase family protein n=1 Tax=Curvibacter soli TaxID=3031331 RepID=UPI0023DCDA93|nr:aspartate/glutamate racemase family protein [Ramlibacter sp. H39-3-26]MDF1485652.1 aspartate/glutamate racemase family protein [Ramlibacter sp. H39-3-26]
MNAPAAPAPHRLLVINPNTTEAITALLRQHLHAALAAQAVQVDSVTARFGAPYIADEAGYAVAGHACLDAWAARLAQVPGQAPDAVLIGCFGDPGLWALRESAPVPVTGLAEAAFTEAARHGRFAVVTGGARWRPMLERLAQALGFGAQLALVHTVAPSGAALAADPAAAHQLLATACQAAAVRSGARSVVLGGAGLAGMAALVQPLVNVPVIDSVAAGARHAATLFGQPGERAQAGFDVPSTGLSAELALLAPRSV